jgi:hypothetical protein
MGETKSDRLLAARNRGKALSFLTLPCLRCSARRVLGQPCDECGCQAPAGEVNARVVERRTGVARVEEELRAAIAADVPPHSTDLPNFESILELLQSFTTALGELIKTPMSEEAAARMAEVQRNIITVQRDCEAHPLLRPAVTLQRAMSRSLSSVSKLWPAYGRALTAPNLHQAQEFGKTGQQLIDAAIAELNAHENLVLATQAYEDLSVADFLDRAMAAISVSHPGLSLLDMGRIGRLEATELTHVATDDAHGAQYMLLSTIASIHLDPERFSAVIAKSAQFCLAAPNLGNIAQEDGALDGLSTITRMLHESLASFEAILVRESDDKALLRRIIKFYGEVYEDVGAPLFAWYNLLTNTKQQPYTKLIQLDASKLAQSLVDGVDTASFLQDAGRHLRNAAQHGSSFSISGEMVTFRLRSYQEQCTRGQVLDTVFSLLESLSALSWSLSNALTQRGYPIPISEEDAAYMRLTPFRLVTLWLKDRGTPAVIAGEAQASWRFTIETQPDDLFSLALTLAGGTPEHISKVGVRSSTSEADLIVPYPAYALFTQWPADKAAPHEHLVAVIELRSICMKGNHSLLTDGDLRHATGCLGLLLFSGDQSVIPSLRRVLRMARDRRWAVVENFASECISLWRNPDAQRVRRLTAELTKWVNLHPSPEMPESRSVIVSNRP